MRPLLLGAAAAALVGCATAPVPSGTAVPASAPLPGSSTLEVQVVGVIDPHAAQADVPVTVHSTRLRRPVHTYTDQAGRVVLTGLPSGVYDVRAESGQRVVTTVPPQGETHVELWTEYARTVICWCYGPPSIDRSLFDDDAASEFLHEPKVIHRLP